MAEPRREYAVAVGLCLLAGGAATFGASRTWASAVVQSPGFPRTAVHVSGSGAVPLTAAAGLVILAGTVVLLATRSWGRRVTAVLVTLAALTIVVATATAGPALTSAVHDAVGRQLAAANGSTSWHGEWWRWLTLAAGALGVLGGGLTVWRGHTWPAMGRRYDAPAVRADAASRTREGAHDSSETELWQALDEGRDPTT